MGFVIVDPLDLVFIGFPPLFANVVSTCVSEEVGFCVVVDAMSSCAIGKVGCCFMSFFVGGIVVAKIVVVVVGTIVAKIVGGDATIGGRVDAIVGDSIATIEDFVIVADVGVYGANVAIRVLWLLQGWSCCY